MGLPSFFKIMISDFKSLLRLPRSFVKKFGDVFPEKALLETKYGESWSIKIEKIGEDYCFTHGWPQFVTYHRLEMCDLLLFSPMPEGESIFRVSIFGPSACEKEITFGTTTPCNSDPEDLEIDLENTCGPSTPNAVRVSSSQESMDYDSNDCGGTKGNSSKSNSMMKEEGTGNRVEFSDDFVTGSGSSRRLVVCLKKYNKCRMAIPVKFARENGIIGKENMTLVNSKGETWPVALVMRSANRCTVIEMTKGWSEFWKKNRLIVGRRCAFEFIPGSDCFRVQLLGRD